MPFYVSSSEDMLLQTHTVVPKCISIDYTNSKHTTCSILSCGKKFSALVNFNTMFFFLMAKYRANSVKVLLLTNPEDETQDVGLATRPQSSHQLAWKRLSLTICLIAFCIKTLIAPPRCMIKCILKMSYKVITAQKFISLLRKQRDFLSNKLQDKKWTWTEGHWLLLTNVILKQNY